MMVNLITPPNAESLLCAHPAEEIIQKHIKVSLIRALVCNTFSKRTNVLGEIVETLLFLGEIKPEGRFKFQLSKQEVVEMSLL